MTYHFYLESEERILIITGSIPSYSRSGGLYTDYNAVAHYDLYKGSSYYHSWDIFNWTARVITGGHFGNSSSYGAFYNCYVSLSTGKATRCSQHYYLSLCHRRYFYIYIRENIWRILRYSL